MKNLDCIAAGEAKASSVLGHTLIACAAVMVTVAFFLFAEGNPAVEIVAVSFAVCVLTGVAGVAGHAITGDTTLGHIVPVSFGAAAYYAAHQEWVATGETPAGFLPLQVITVVAVVVATAVSHILYVPPAPASEQDADSADDGDDEIVVAPATAA